MLLSRLIADRLVAITRMPRPFASRATLLPMPPRPTMPIVLPAISFMPGKPATSCAVPANVFSTAQSSFFANMNVAPITVSAIGSAFVQPRELVSGTPSSPHHCEFARLETPAKEK